MPPALLTRCRLNGGPVTGLQVHYLRVHCLVHRLGCSPLALVCCNNHGRLPGVPGLWRRAIEHLPQGMPTARGRLHYRRCVRASHQAGGADARLCPPRPVRRRWRGRRQAWSISARALGQGSPYGRSRRRQAAYPSGAVWVRLPGGHGRSHTVLPGHGRRPARVEAQAEVSAWRGAKDARAREPRAACCPASAAERPSHRRRREHRHAVRIGGLYGVARCDAALQVCHWLRICGRYSRQRRVSPR